MKRVWSVAAVCVLLAALPLQAQVSTSKMLADASAKANMLGFLSYTFANDLTKQNVFGQALCIDSSGIFATYAADATMKTGNVSDAVLRLTDGKAVTAKLMWVDPETGLAFFRASGATFTAAKFAMDAKYTVGAQVASVGLLENDVSHTPYVSSAYISAVIRTPDPIVYVTNGNLTGDCSPVFDENGLVVGLVGQQPFQRYQTTSQQGPQDVYLKSRQTTSFFIPAANFATVLDYLAKNPDKPRQMPWFGVLSLQGSLGQNTLLPNSVAAPSVIIDKVVAGQLGEKAGLKDMDAIVAVNGQPFEKQPVEQFVAQDLQRRIAKLGVGTEVTLTVHRGAQDLPIKVKLEPMPPGPMDAARSYIPSLGVLVRDRVLLDKYTVDSAKSEGGVLVVGIAKGGPAETDLQQNDCVVVVNDQKIETVADMQKIVDNSINLNRTKPIIVVVRRGTTETKSFSLQPVTQQPTSAPATAPAK